jgi:hypothetical protein
LPAVPPTPPPPPWAVAADALVAFSVLPDPAYGAWARVERAMTPVIAARAGLEGLGSFGERFAGVAGYFDTQLVAARVDVCAALPVSRRVSAGACMGVSGGVLHTEGYGYPSARGAFEGWLAIANELRAELEVNPQWSVGLAGALLLPVGRNSIVLRTNDGQVQSSRDLPGLGWSIALGPVRRF